jgi:tRNA1(Val) A37 N6-methylase TrmN6
MSHTGHMVLPGGVKVYQDPGASVTTDTLLIASFLSVSPGSVIADLGCGGGAASIYSSALNPGCRWIGADIRYASLRLMLDSIGLQGDPPDLLPVCCGIESLPLALPEGIADAVIMNPPYIREGKGRKSPCDARDRSRMGSDLLLQQFIRGVSHLLARGGKLITVNVPSSLPDILLGCRASGIHPFEIQPVGETNKPAERILLKGIKGSGAALSVLPQKQVEDLIRQPS